MANKDGSAVVKRQPAKEITIREKLTMCLAETVGTGLLVLFGCMGCVGSQPHINIAVGFGLTVMFIIQTFGHISGSHLNPAVTLAAVILGYQPYNIAPFYVISQVIGAVFGFGILKLITPTKWFESGLVTIDTGNGNVTYGVCTTFPAADVTMVQALLVEYLATAVLIFVCCGVWDPRNSDKHDSTPLRFGFTIASLAIVSGPYTGCSMNPARSFGPAVWNNNWHGHWIYWLGPIMASATTAGFYRIVFSQRKTVEEHEDIPLR